jgi:CubicO group peptidase (beta-lactamase class C family)
MARLQLAPLVTLACLCCGDVQSDGAAAKGVVGDTTLAVGARPPQPGIRFDPSTLRPGQTIGAVVADSVSAQLAVVDSTYVGYARFRGELELTGRIVPHFDADLREVTTCFEADSLSAARLPRWSADERRPWFCFENRTEAERAVRDTGEGSVLTIVIDDFTIHRNLSDAVNSASFVRLGRGSTARTRHAADSLLESLHARGYFNGAVVLGRGDQEIYARGFGAANVGAGVPFTPDTPADGGSIAKTFTAAAVLMLEGEGRLMLDDAVQEFIPEYPHPDTRIRDLLTHSAGLPVNDYDFFEGMIPSDSVKTTRLFVELLRSRNVAPLFPRGTRFSYSSLGFDIAALVVERITGQPWERFLQARVFTPLGMEDTFLRPARFADWSAVRTLSYKRSGNTLVLHDVFDNEGFYGGSNLYFSARDLHRWSRSFYTRPVLTPGALARGREAVTLRDRESGTGGESALTLLSWYYHPRARRYHYPGSLQGFWGSVYRDEERRYSIVYLSNNSMPQWLRPLLTRALIDIMEGRGPVPLPAQPFAALPASDLAALAGTYRVDRVGMVTLAVRARRLFVRIGRGIEYPAFPVEDGQLYVPGLDVWIGFPADSASDTTRRGFRRMSWLSIFEVSEGRRP